jgi:hypothetical protein
MFSALIVRHCLGIKLFFRKGRRMDLANDFPAEARDLLVVRGRDLLHTLGLPALRDVVSQVLCGVNVRSATEMLTRRRISLLNAAIFTTYTNLAKKGIDFMQVPSMAHLKHQTRGTSEEDKIILRWMLGLTKKQVQNVLRSDAAAWSEYVLTLKDSLLGVIETVEDSYGLLKLTSDDADADSMSLDWTWVVSMMMAIGAQTLAIRGSEKSIYGKFFEKMILGSVLSVLGFKFSSSVEIAENTFWLSSTAKRESDATIVWKPGLGIRFDIGFIGVGNTEITLDKVTRFQRHIEINGVSMYMHTFIVVDRVGPKSGVVELAQEVDGTIIQMSSSDWASTLGNALEELLDGYVSPLKGLSHSDYKKAIEEGVQKAPLEKIFDIAIADSPEQESELPDE